MADGQAFEDLEGFKQIILRDPDKIARNFLEKVLTYATGASIEYSDRREIDEIVKKSAAEDYGIRSLIHQAARRSIFQSK